MALNLHLPSENRAFVVALHGVIVQPAASVRGGRGFAQEYTNWAARAQATARVAAGEPPKWGGFPTCGIRPKYLI
jgi:hypothetical protein